MTSTLTYSDPTPAGAENRILMTSFAAHRRAIDDAETACASSMARLCELAAETLESGRRIFFFGNGGSAADAQHLAAELSVRFIRDRRALAGIALTSDTAVLTACGNDLGFEQIFARQLEALGQAGDLALALTTSGNSQNIVSALECARGKGMFAAALAGRDGGRLRGIADPLVIVPAQQTATIQEVQILLGHILCAEIERRLGLDSV